MRIPHIDPHNPICDTVAARPIGNIEGIEHREGTGLPGCEVEAQTSGGIVAPLISMRSATELELRTGNEVTASVKATDVAPAILD